MIYEIINPSDFYTCECDDPAVGMACLLLIGEGHIGMKEADGGDPQKFIFSPIFCSPLKEFEARFGVKAEDVLRRYAECADFFDSVLIGGVSDRKTYRKGIDLCAGDEAKLRDWREHWHDERRSSMTDIGRACWRRAEQFRELAAKAGAA